MNYLFVNSKYYLFCCHQLFYYKIKTNNNISMKNVRSQFIEEVLSKQTNLDKMMQEATNSTLDTLLEKKVSDSIRKFLNEDSEKDVDEKPIDDDDKDLLNDVEDTDDDTETVAGTETPADENGEEGLGDDDIDAEEGDDIWGDIEDLKNEEGAYDLRGMDIGELSKYVSTLGPTDGVTVEFDNGEMTIEDNTDGKTIEIDLESAVEGDEDAITVDGTQYDDEDEVEIDFEFDDDTEDGEEDEFEIDLEGDNEDIIEPDAEDGETDIELELDDDTEDNGEADEIEETLSRGKATDRSTTMGRFRRNASRNGQEVTDSTEEEYDANPNGVNENIVRKMDAILKENAALKKLIPQIQEQLNMATVVNTSLGNIVKLVNEHTTTTDEKKQLVERFNKCKTSEDSNKLYEQIRMEYANAEKSNTNNFSTVLNGQIKEAIENPVKQTINESVNEKPVMDEGLFASLEFMERLNKIR